MLELALLDLEGTLAHGNDFIPLQGAVALMNNLRKRGVPIRVLSNNTIQTPDIIAQKLSRGGLTLSSQEIITPLSALSAAVSPGERAYVVGSAALKAHLKSCGHTLSDDGDRATCVVVGGSHNVVLDELDRACRALLGGAARFIALHKGRLYTDERGHTVLGSGAFVAALEYASGIQSTVVGKPNSAFFRDALRSSNATAQHTVMIGDDPYMDLAPAREIGIRTAFVASGKYAAKEFDSLGWRPDFIVDSLDRLAGYL